MFTCLPPGEALHVWTQPYSELHCGYHQQSTEGSKPQALLCMGEFNLIHNIKGGSGTSGAALEMLAGAKLLTLAAHKEKIPNKQTTESCNWDYINMYVFTEKSCFFNIFFAAPRAQELELEDHQSRLEQKLREKMAIDGKSEETVCSSPQGQTVPTLFAPRRTGVAETPVLPLSAAQPAKYEVFSSDSWWRQLSWPAPFYSDLDQKHCTCNCTNCALHAAMCSWWWTAMQSNFFSHLDRRGYLLLCSIAGYPSVLELLWGTCDYSLGLSFHLGFEKEHGEEQCWEKSGSIALSTPKYPVVF